MAKEINFSHTLYSPASPHFIWEEFRQSMINSSDSKLWPPQSEVIGEGLYQDAKITVNYKLGPVSRTYKYTINVLQEGTSFEYIGLAGEHPFIGGATIEVLEDKISGGTKVTWKGKYITPTSAWLSRLAFKRYERAFFLDLEKNLLAL